MAETQYPAIKNGGLTWGPAKGGGDRPASGLPCRDGPEATLRRRRERELAIAEKAMQVFDDVLSLPAGGLDGPSYRDKLTAATYVYDKAFGKATQQQNVSVSVVDPKTVSDEELMRIALQRDPE